MPQKKSVLTETIIEILRSKDLAFKFLFGDNKISNINIPFSSLYSENYIQSYEKTLNIFKYKFNNNIFEIYDYLSQNLLYKVQNEIRINCEDLEIYQLYSSYIDTLPIIAFKISKILDTDKYNSDLYTLENFIKSFNLIPFPPLKHRIKEISDLHFHLGGALKYSYRLNSLYLKYKHKTEGLLPDEIYIKLLQEEIDIDLLIMLFYILESFIFIDYLGLNILALNDLFYLKNNKKLKIDKFFEKIKDKIHDRYFLYKVLKKLKWFNLRNKELNLEHIISGKGIKKLILTSHIKFKEKNIYLADFFMILSMIKIAKKEKNLKNYIFAYFILRNIIKSLIVQQHRRADFSYFSSFSQSYLKNSKIYEEYKYIYDNLLEENKNINLNVELRVSIPNSAKYMSKLINNIASNFSTKFPKRNDNVHYLTSNNIRYNIVFCIKKEKDKIIEKLIKNNQTQNSLLKNSEIIRWEDLRKKLRNISFELRKFLNSYENSKYLAGIDVVSNENFSPPEVFAKIFRYLKISHRILKDSSRANISRLMFTFHVGEDFDNLLTGIRRVYESIIFLDLGKGDRLSHLFSLGVEPSLVRRRRDANINITKQDLLDNLVFLYFIIRFSPKLNFEIYSYLEHIKNKAEVLLDEFISYNFKAKKFLKNVSLEDYFESWLLRRNCPLEFKNILKRINFHFEKDRDSLENLIDRLRESKIYLKTLYKDKYYLYASLPDMYYLEYNEKEDSFISSFYQKARRNLNAILFYYFYNYDINWVKKGLEVIEEPVIIRDDVLKILQDIILDIIADKDIFVEILLTSNLLITPIKRYEEHPVLRFLGLKGDRKKTLKVVLGTDNPGIQETSILNEYAILFKLLNKYKDRKDSFNLLTKIINNGNNLFKKRYI